MVDLCSSRLNDRMQQRYKGLGVSTLERLSVSIGEVRGQLDDEFGRHFQLVFRVHAELEMSHATQEMLYPRFRISCWLRRGRVFTELARESIAHSQESVSVLSNFHSPRDGQVAEKFNLQLRDCLPVRDLDAFFWLLRTVGIERVLLQQHPKVLAQLRSLEQLD